MLLLLLLLFVDADGWKFAVGNLPVSLSNTFNTTPFKASDAAIITLKQSINQAHATVVDVVVVVVDADGGKLAVGKLAATVFCVISVGSGTKCTRTKK